MVQRWRSRRSNPRPLARQRFALDSGPEGPTVGRLRVRISLRIGEPVCVVFWQWKHLRRDRSKTRRDSVSQRRRGRLAKRSRELVGHSVGYEPQIGKRSIHKREIIALVEARLMNTIFLWLLADAYKLRERYPLSHTPATAPISVCGMCG
jgi:hypothetical protein